MRDGNRVVTRRAPRILTCIYKAVMVFKYYDFFRFLIHHHSMFNYKYLEKLRKRLRMRKQKLKLIFLNVMWLNNKVKPCKSSTYIMCSGTFMTASVILDWWTYVLGFIYYEHSKYIEILAESANIVLPYKKDLRGYDLFSDLPNLHKEKKIIKVGHVVSEEFDNIFCILLVEDNTRQ